MEMCKRYFDVRTLGAVMSTGLQCRQGPRPGVLSFSCLDRSHPPARREHHAHGCDRCEGERIAKSNDGSEELHSLRPLLLPRLASARASRAETGFTDADLNLLWLALTQTFDHDRSATRGTMAPQNLIVFKHDSALGNAPAQLLLERVTVRRKPSVEVARDFSDYEVNIARDGLPAGVEIIDKI